MQTCIWLSWCHCHSLSLASVKSRLVLPFWYRLTRVVAEKKPLNGCVCVCVCVSSLWNVYHNTKACFFDPPCMWFTSCSVQALSESEMLLVWTVLQVERVLCLKWNCCRLKGRTSCDTCLVAGNLAHISTPWDRNRNQFSSVCTFSILDRNWWFFHMHWGAISYNSVHLF